MKIVAKVLLAIFGILLPAAALLAELSTGMCAEMMFDPIPTWFHAVLVAAVPLANLVLLVAVAREKGLERKSLRVLAGFVVTVSAVYAVPLVPMAFFGFIFACLGFWYFGFGLIGLLPCAPITACISALCLRRRLAKGAGFLRGFLLALALIGVSMADAGIMVLGVRLSQSSDPDTSARGIRLCRLSTRKDVLQRLCRERPAFGRRLVISLPELFFDNQSLDPEMGKWIYYCVTGEDPAVAFASRWNRGRRGLSWDTITGGEKVGGKLEGLSLRGSAYETTLDKVAGVGYGEWTMTFGNSHYSDREARMRIALPHGAVVSRVTLWINGEECEAAFGTKGQVRRAYEAVVRRNRDPLLVNACGPDQVQAQCFPVPRKGEMKIRLGFTIPMSVAPDGKSARLPVPVIVERNFEMAQNLVGLPEPERVTFENALPRLSYYAEEGFAALTNAVVLQTAESGKAWMPKRIAVVLDTSAPMKDFNLDVFAELTGLTTKCQREYWVVGDKDATYGWDSLNWKAGGGFHVDCAGGRSNLRTLLNAVKYLGERGEPAAVVWIHAAQPVEFETGDALAAALNKAENVRLYNLQVNEGPCALLEALPQSDRIVSLTAEHLSAARAGEKGGVLATTFAEDGWRTTRAKVPRSELPEDAVSASKHLGCLWAAEETARLFRPGHPTTLKPAQDLALPWHIVTPVTGAVVLESQQQFDENKLNPVDANSVPTVPEPSTVLCLVLAFCAIVLAVVVRRRLPRRGIAAR